MRCTTSDMSTMRKFTVSLLNPVPNEFCTRKIIENMPCAQRAHRKIFLGENFIVCKTEHTRFNYALLRTAITKSKSKTETTKHTLEMNIKKNKSVQRKGTCTIAHMGAQQTETRSEKNKRYLKRLFAGCGCNTEHERIFLLSVLQCEYRISQHTHTHTRWLCLAKHNVHTKLYDDFVSFKLFYFVSILSHGCGCCRWLVALVHC